MKTFKLLLPIILVLGYVGYILMQRHNIHSEFLNMNFHGPVLSKIETPTTNKAMKDLAFTISVQGADGKVHEWRTSELTAGYFALGDYVVKFAGKDRAAVFRNGKQLMGNGIPYYLEEPVDLAAIKARPTP